MNAEYKHLLDQNFDPASKVWVYQSSRFFTLSQALKIEDMLDQFVRDWVSHGIPVKGNAHLFFVQFVVLMADENASGVSGCSIDSSMRLIKEIEQTSGVTMFERTNLAFFLKDKAGDHHVEILPMSQLQYAVDN